MLKGKTVILGITGSIAAYKGAEICRQLVKSGVRVRVIMTEAATAFVNPLTFETLTSGPVGTTMFNNNRSWDIQHVSWTQEADLFLIAPATANVIGKITHGIADDLLTSSVMATTAPVVIAPAMNKEMYNNPINQDNMDRLKSYGYKFIEPGTGYLACGDEGKGRLADPQQIADFALSQLVLGEDLKGCRFLITAGPTREPLDPVRYVSNNSSGKMGYALAEAASQRGGEVVLISGPTCLPAPPGMTFIPVKTTLEMREKALEEFSMADYIIKAAAVADYRPLNFSRHKIKKKEGNLELELQRNPDILEEMGKIKNKQVLVGFAAETKDLFENACNKLTAKNLDMIIANDLGQSGAGFEVDTNIVTIINHRGEVLKMPVMAKRELADKILDQILRIKKST